MAVTADTEQLIQTYLPPNITFVYTDIETESIQARVLLQIAAVGPDGSAFNVYVNPNCDLPLACSNFSGFYYYNGQLYRNGLRLHSVNVVRALHEFTNFIAKFPGPVALVFHNGFGFDCSHLARLLLKFNVPKPNNLTTVVDLLPYVRSTLKPPLVENHKLTTLAKFLGIRPFQAHDAFNDSLALKRVCEALAQRDNVTLHQIFKIGFRPFNDYLDQKLLGTPVTPLIKIKKPKTKKPSKKKSKPKQAVNEKSK